jgi:hypothetical protein
VLLSLPSGCYLPPPLLLAAPEPEPALPSVSPRLSVALSELETRPTAFLGATLQLLHIVSTGIGSSSWLAPYASSLPSSYPHLPMCWSDTELAALRGTTIDRRVVDRVERLRFGLDIPKQAHLTSGTLRQCEEVAAVTPEAGCSCSHALREAFDRFVRPLVVAHPELFPPSICTLSQFRSCACAVSSRSFAAKSRVVGMRPTAGDQSTRNNLFARAAVSRHHRHEAENDDEANDGDITAEEQVRYMLPLVDMLNHCDTESAATILRFDQPLGDGAEGTFSMVAERNIAAGEVVEHSYGALLTDAQLVLSYGFCLLNAPSPRCCQYNRVSIDSTAAAKCSTGTAAIDSQTARTYRCCVDLPLPLLRLAALSLGLIGPGDLGGQDPTDELCNLRSLALQCAGLEILCGQSGRSGASNTGCSDHSESSSAEVVLLESNWVIQEPGSQVVDDAVEDQEEEGQEIVGRQIGGAGFVIGALILAMDTTEQLHQYIEQSEASVAAGRGSNSKPQSAVDTGVEDLESDHNDVLATLAELCATLVDSSVDVNVPDTVKMAALGGCEGDCDLRLLKGLALGLSLRQTQADRNRIGMRLTRLLIKTIELRDGLYPSCTLAEDEAALEALNGLADGPGDTQSSRDGNGEPPEVVSRQSVSSSRATTALAVRVGERRLLHAVKEFFAALEAEAVDGNDEERGSEHNCISLFRETKRQRVPAGGDL